MWGLHLLLMGSVLLAPGDIAPGIRRGDSEILLSTRSHLPSWQESWQTNAGRIRGQGSPVGAVSEDQGGVWRPLRPSEAKTVWSDLFPFPLGCLFVGICTFYCLQWKPNNQNRFTIGRILFSIRVLKNTGLERVNLCLILVFRRGLKDILLPCRYGAPK